MVGDHPTAAIVCALRRGDVGRDCRDARDAHLPIPRSVRHGRRTRTHTMLAH